MIPSTVGRGRDRRQTDRVALEIFLNQYVAERLQRGVTSNLSPSGLFVNRVTLPRRIREARPNLQLEFALPGTSDTIWAAGEVCYESLADNWVQGSGVRLIAIAQSQARLLRDYVFELKRQRLQEILQRMTQNRYH